MSSRDNSLFTTLVTCYVLTRTVPLRIRRERDDGAKKSARKLVAFIVFESNVNLDAKEINVISSHRTANDLR